MVVAVVVEGKELYDGGEVKKKVRGLLRNLYSNSIFFTTLNKYTLNISKNLCHLRLVIAKNSKNFVSISW
jgi:phage anti-repressor protein